jgi:hypothetical protein
MADSGEDGGGERFFAANSWVWATDETHGFLPVHVADGFKAGAAAAGVTEAGAPFEIAAGAASTSCRPLDEVTATYRRPRRKDVSQRARCGGVVVAAYW